MSPPGPSLFLPNASGRSSPLLRRGTDSFDVIVGDDLEAAFTGRASVVLDAIGIPTARIVRADCTPCSIRADFAGLLARNRLGVRLERMNMARSYIGEMGQNWQEWLFCSID